MDRLLRLHHFPSQNLDGLAITIPTPILLVAHHHGIEQFTQLLARCRTRATRRTSPVRARTEPTCSNQTSRRTSLYTRLAVTRCTAHLYPNISSSSLVLDLVLESRSLKSSLLEATSLPSSPEAKTDCLLGLKNSTPPPSDSVKRTTSRFQLKERSFQQHSPVMR